LCRALAWNRPVVVVVVAVVGVLGLRYIQLNSLRSFAPFVPSLSLYTIGSPAILWKKKMVFTTMTITMTVLGNSHSTSQRKPSFEK
jgi:hypothetical protein